MDDCASLDSVEEKAVEEAAQQDVDMVKTLTMCLVMTIRNLD